MNDSEWLKSLPREKSPEEVERIERDRDARRGAYQPHGRAVHHGYGEAER